MVLGGVLLPSIFLSECDSLFAGDYRVRFPTVVSLHRARCLLLGQGLVLVTDDEVGASIGRGIQGE